MAFRQRPALRSGEAGRPARRSRSALIGALGLLAAATVPTAAHGDAIDWLDHSFGGGLQTFDLSPKSDAAAAVAVQGDGKLLVAASVNKHSSPNAIAVLRFLPDGRPDGNFGTAGRVLLANQGTPTIGMAVQGDGRILVGVNLGTGFRVIRLEASGLLDTTFNAAHVILELLAGGLEYNALALAPDGKVVVGGSFLTANNSRGLVVARLQADGALDPSFGTGGLVLRRPPAGFTNWSETVSSLGVRPDGTVVVGGSISYGTFPATLPVSGWFLLTQLTPAGAFDAGFGDRGTVHTDLSRGATMRDAHLRGITLQGDGKIVAAGQAYERNGGSAGFGVGHQAVARYLPDGRLDPGFGSAGIVVSPAPPSSRATTTFYGDSSALTVAVDGKGRIVTGGAAWGAGTMDMALTRYTPTGVIDQSFGRSGWMKVERDTHNDELTALAVQPDGGIVLAGSLGDQVLAVGRIPAPEAGTTIRAWGWNGLGQLGDDSTVQRNLPVPAPGSATTVTPAGGGYHSLSLRDDGTVLAAGWNGVGQLGNGTTTDRDTLAPVPGLGDVTHVAAGAHHSLAVSGGRVYAWGWNASGQLGDGTLTNRLTPTLVPGLAGAVEVAAGAYHSLARLSDGTIWAWGSNVYGQLGDGTILDRLQPVQVAGLRSASAISAGALHSLAVAVTTEWPAEGVWAWGWNAMGQSDPDSVGLPHVPWPQLVLPGRPVAIAAGGYHNVVIGGDGALSTWGWNALGQLGNGTTNVVNGIVRVATITDPVRVAAGGGHTMAIDVSGRTWAWGWNAMGQLGDGTTTDRYSPVVVPGVDGALALSGGWYHSMGAVSGG
jgi:uncharacterized delta-60 repeat protein